MTAVKYLLSTMEVWGGIECTINRVRDLYIDQLEYSGHYRRLEDIKLFSELGIKKMRYPVLWEKHQPDAEKPIDWIDTEKRLLGLKQYGIECIAGLVHHGSGPRYVSMLDDSFVKGLAAYARQVAEKFPWINFYTPVNEPLTTARFCGLYGLWYPHGTDNRSFVRILLNECTATILAMREVRSINPHAKLVQTEDLGKVHSYPSLHYQAAFENHRRWLSLDLLCGKVVPDHPLYSYLIDNGAGIDELAFFTAHPCTPDIMGFNYYITSERYLDPRTSRFPPHTRGSNGRHKYADVEAVRVGNIKVSGPVNLLKEAWERYKLPLAVTEVHMHCTREEQLRWLQTIWDAANELIKENIDIRGVTAWALLGSYGWNKLLTRPRGDYEPGVFDLRSGWPRPTALSTLLKSLSKGLKYEHPVMVNKGWWSRHVGIIYNRPKSIAEQSAGPDSPPLIIAGPSAIVNQAFDLACSHRNIGSLLLSPLDSDSSRLCEQLMQLNPWGIIYTHGLVDVSTEVASFQDYLHTDHLHSLARFTSRYNIKLLSFSGALVFDTIEKLPVENKRSDESCLILNQPKSAVQSILNNDPSALIAETGFLYNHPDQKDKIAGLLGKFRPQPTNNTERYECRQAVYIPDLVHAFLDLMIDDETGVWHIENSTQIRKLRDPRPVNVLVNQNSR